MNVLAANLHDPAHQAAIVELLNLYAQETVGRGEALSDEVLRVLPERLAAIPTCRVWLAYEGAAAVGVCVAFLGFSTFQARPLLNLHDVVVRPGYRGQGIGKKLLAAAEEGAREMGCCKLTLEVNVDNEPARRCYAQCGFAVGTPAQEFWNRRL